MGEVTPGLESLLESAREYGVRFEVNDEAKLSVISSTGLPPVIHQQISINERELRSVLLHARSLTPEQVATAQNLADVYRFETGLSLALSDDTAALILPKIHGVTKPLLQLLHRHRGLMVTYLGQLTAKENG